jgi:hypothetical protein
MTSRGIRTPLAAIHSRSKMHHISSVRGRGDRRTAATNHLAGGYEMRSRELDPDGGSWRAQEGISRGDVSRAEDERGGR